MSTYLYVSDCTVSIRPGHVVLSSHSHTKYTSSSARELCILSRMASDSDPKKFLVIDIFPCKEIVLGNLIREFLSFDANEQKK